MSGNVKLALSHVVPDLAHKILKGQDPLHILGDGDQVRHYTYGGDLAHGIRLAMESPAAVNDDFNLSTAASTTVLELAEAIWHKIHADGRPFHYVSDPPVRARRPAARPRRAQGARGARLRGDDHARPDARRGHPVDPRRSGRRPAVSRSLDDLYQARFDEREVSAKQAVWDEIARYLQRYVDPDTPVLDLACDRGHFIRPIKSSGALGDRHPGHERRPAADVRFVQASGLELDERCRRRTSGPCS